MNLPEGPDLDPQSKTNLPVEDLDEDTGKGSGNDDGDGKGEGAPPAYQEQQDSTFVSALRFLVCHIRQKKGGAATLHLFRVQICIEDTLAERCSEPAKT